MVTVNMTVEIMIEVILCGHNNCRDVFSGP